METPSFIFGGSTGLSYEELQRRRKVLDALAARGNGAPQNVGEGIYSLAQGLTEGLEGRMLRGQQAKADAAGSALGAAGLSAVTAPYTMASATAPGATVNPTVADPTMGGIQAPGATVGGGGTAEMPSGEIYGSFMDTVRQGDAARNIPGVTNPYGLAAVASTGKAESGFDPGNVYRQWADPSQSGQPGNAGGIMSWRAERLENMRNFAAKNGGDPNRPSPQLQAQFFLNEDPGLIAKLNAAKSPEEAQTLMNNAWRFAGYDNPNGGEAARRIATARSYAPSFAGQSQAAAPSAPQQVASLDPAAGMNLTTAIAPPDAVQPGPVNGGRAAVQQALQAQPQATPQQAPSPAVQRVAQAMPQPPQPPSGQIPPEALRALADPSVPESQKQAIQIGLRQRQQGEAALYERQMAIYQQQAQQIQMQQKQAYDEQVRQQGYQREDARFGVTDAREAVRLDLERQRFERDGVKPPQWQELPNGDYGYFDPQTKQFQRLGNAPKAAENGITIGPDGSVQIGGSQKPLTEGQSKDAVFSTRATGALQILDQYAPALTSRTDAALGAVPMGLGRGAQNTEYQLAKQAGDEFLQAILRKDTGAAIQQDEQTLYGGVYLPQPGDSPELLDQKQVSRTRAVEAIKAGMPPQAIVAQEIALRKTEAAKAAMAEKAGQTPGAATPPRDTIVPGSDAGTDAPAAPAIPQGMDPAMWNIMTPEERALWQK